MVTTKIIFPNMLKLYIIRLLFVYWPIFIKTLRLQMLGKWDITSDTKCYDVIIGTRIDVFRHTYFLYIFYIYYTLCILCIHYILFYIYIICYFILYIIYYIFYIYIHNLQGLSMLIIFYWKTIIWKSPRKDICLLKFVIFFTEVR